MRLLYVSVGLVWVILGLILVEFAIDSFASNDWLPPPSASILFVPALAAVVFLAGTFFILFAFTEGE